MNNIELYTRLHKQDTSYGASGQEYYPEICLIIDFLKPKIVLDFGCGKGTLITQLQKKYPAITFYGYDPAIPEKSVLPVKHADLVINTDVLEHIPEEQLPDIVKQIGAISDKVVFVLHHALAINYLPNGENAHCTVKPLLWYYQLFEKQFHQLTLLPGRYPWLSTVLTFPISVELFNSYNREMALSGTLRHEIISSTSKISKMFLRKIHMLISRKK